MANIETSEQRKEALIRAIMQDKTLPAVEKEKIIRKINQPGFVAQLLSGTFGAAVAMAISRFFRMPPLAQAVVSGTGFGIGHLLSSVINNSRKPGIYSKTMKREAFEYDPQYGGWKM